MDLSRARARPEGGFTAIDTFNFIVARQPNDADLAVGTGWT
jgi:hypothetical protein